MENEGYRPRHWEYLPDQEAPAVMPCKTEPVTARERPGLLPLGAHAGATAVAGVALYNGTWGLATGEGGSTPLENAVITAIGAGVLAFEVYAAWKRWIKS
jgi:hypothetical protein